MGWTRTLSAREIKRNSCPFRHGKEIGDGDDGPSSRDLWCGSEPRPRDARWEGWMPMEGGALHRRVSRWRPSTTSPFLRIIHATRSSQHGRIGTAIMHGTRCATLVHRHRGVRTCVGFVSIVFRISPFDPSFSIPTIGSSNRDRPGSERNSVRLVDPMGVL